MKRIRVAPGKFVTISTELAEKAARVFTTGLTRDQLHHLKAGEPRGAKGLMVGSAKPLAITQAKTRAGAKAKLVGAPAPARKITTSTSSASDAQRQKVD